MDNDTVLPYIETAIKSYKEAEETASADYAKKLQEKAHFFALLAIADQLQHLNENLEFYLYRTGIIS